MWYTLYSSVSTYTISICQFHTKQQMAKLTFNNMRSNQWELMFSVRANMQTFKQVYGDQCARSNSQPTVYFVSSGLTSTCTLCMQCTLPRSAPTLTTQAVESVCCKSTHSVQWSSVQSLEEQLHPSLDDHCSGWCLHVMRVSIRECNNVKLHSTVLTIHPVRPSWRLLTG